MAHFVGDGVDFVFQGLNLLLEEGGRLLDGVVEKLARNLDALLQLVNTAFQLDAVELGIAQLAVVKSHQKLGHRFAGEGLVELLEEEKRREGRLLVKFLN